MTFKMFLGGFAYKNQNSPPSGRRSIWGNACSPFRNSDMSRPLEDIVNLTAPIGLGTNGNGQEKASPSNRQIIGVGRTFKDYEDQLDSLKRDNFNLKLRIYFLEEKMGSSAPDQNAIRESIELKVEVESLRKELAEKQELLSQAAKAFELIDEQKKMLSKEQSMYQKSLDEEREKIKQLENEIEEYKEKMSDCSLYYKEALGITPETAIENEKKLHQLEELVSSLEAEVKQLAHSLEEERSWNQELEKERDEFRERIEMETRNRNKLTSERNAEIDRLHEKIRELEEIILRKDSNVQQYRNELIEKERILKEKCSQLEEKMRMCDELYAVSEKRKKQIDSLRLSLKTKDDSFTDLSNKHRLLVSQLENSYIRRNTPPNSPSTLSSLDSSPRLGRSRLSPSKNENEVFNWEVPEKYSQPSSAVKTSSKDLSQELDEKERDYKQLTELNKQLLVKLSTLEKTSEQKEKELELQKEGYQRALESIRELMDRYHTLEKSYRELAKLNAPRKHERSNRSNSSSAGSPLSRRNYRELCENPERDHDNNKRRFDEMESKIDDLRTEIETIKAEKVKLEEQIQTEAEELQEKLLTREQKIELLEHERDEIREELLGKITELNKLKENCHKVPLSPNKERTALQQVINEMNQELDEKNHTIEQLSKELQVKTQNLQKLVNTELWSKNKEIAKLHNHMSTSQCSEKCHDGVQLANLIRELNDIGINVKITDDIIQLNYVNGNGEIDVKTMTEYIQKLIVQKKKLENEVDYLKWLKLVSKPDIVGELDVESENEKVQKYCDLLRAHLKELMKFMKNLLRSDNLYDEEQHRNILEVLKKSQFISPDFVQALLNEPAEDRFNTSLTVKKSRSDNTIELLKSRVSTPSDSEVFSEPDRNVSMARIGLQEQQLTKRESPRSKSKYSRVASDSEDSEEYIPQYKFGELNEDANIQLQGLKRMLSFLYNQLISFRDDCNDQVMISVDDDRLTVLIEKTKQSQKMCESLQSIIDKKMMYDSRSLKKASKQHSLKKSQLEKKLTDVENMAHEISKQKLELVEYKDNLDRRTSELLINVNRENESLKAKVKKLEDDITVYKSNLSALSKDLDQLTISHSHTLVENSKLTNEKLKLEHELRKSENLYDTTVRSLQQKCNKEINDLNHIIDSHHDRMQELEVTNKELRRQVVACEVSDSAPSSSGVSSMIPVESLSRPAFDDIVPEFQNTNGCYWWQMNAPSTSTRSKSSCSPDLGIESDGTATSTRPLQERPKVSGSMTNLLSDTEQRLQDDVGNESPLPTEGGHNYSYEDIEALRQENEALKLRLLKTRKALEDTFRNLMTSNKNKKNVEKAITRHLMMTEDIWKKTKSYEQTFENC